MLTDTSQVDLVTIDYVLIGVYLTLLVGMGLHYRKYAQQGLEHFFLGGRRFKGWMTGTSYGMLLGHYLPPGLLGLALVALFASIMSTVDSNMNFGAQVFINDLYRRLIRPQASVDHYLQVGKIGMLVMLGLALVVAILADRIIDIAVFILGLSSAEITANWGQWWWWRFNGKARLAASLGGPAIFLINRFLVLPVLLGAGQESLYIAVLASVALTTVLWIVVALLTSPDPEETLVEFYKRARPMGWWGPIAHKAGREESGGRPIFSGLGTALLGASAIGASTIAFSAIYVARWEVAAVATSVAVLTGFFFRRAYTALFRDWDQLATDS